MKKNELENKGIPLFVNEANDLPGRPGATFDSFFVSCEFEGEEGNRYGVVWHQQTQFGKFMTAQVLLADPANAVCDNTPFAAPVGAGCLSSSVCPLWANSQVTVKRCISSCIRRKQAPI